METCFVSTSIPYVNAPPHLGFALELVLADVIARHERRRGDAVYFLSGTDEHSLKNALAAEAEGVSTRALVDRHAATFAALKPLLDISYNDFLRTSGDPRHAPAVEKLWRDCERSGDVYVGRYEGLYCVGCEQFYARKELAEGRCPEHGVPPEHVSERNYFFRLSRYQTELVRLIASDVIVIRPAHRKNEVLAFLESPLQDFSISRSVERSRGWGVPVPDDASQTIYVWFDALANYISALGYGGESEETLRRNWTYAANIRHVIGKGVIRFHAVYWPAILLSAGLRPPSEILVHGYVTVEGRKISKSIGNGIAPEKACRRYGADALRYYLLRHVGSQRDGDFSWSRYDQVYEHELANDLGNLVSRTTALGRRYGQPARADSRLAAGLLEEVARQVEVFALDRALDAVWAVIAEANAYVNRTEPWKLAKAGQTEAVAEVLRELYAALACIAAALEPFLPDTARRIVHALGGQTRAPLFPRGPRRAAAAAPAPAAIADVNRTSRSRNHDCS